MFILKLWITKMTILAIILILLYALEIYSDARWDAEAFKEGESNHEFKSMRIMVWLAIVMIFGIMSHLIYWEFFWWLKLGILALIYPFQRVMLFDNFLNHYSDKPKGYKTKIWLQWVAAIIMIGLLTLFYLI
jgi:hypothetical protein